MNVVGQVSGAQQLRTLDEELDAAYPLPSITRVARTALVITFVALGGLVGWAVLTPLEKAIIAPGNLIAEGRRKVINLAEPGVLRQILVRDGDPVTVGQVLLRLDTTQAQAMAEQAKAQYYGGLARIARLKAEQADQRFLVIPPEIERAAADALTLRELIDTERRLFPARWEAYDGSVSVQERVIAQLTAQASGIPRQRLATERQLTVIRERIRGFEDLARSGAGSRFRVLELIEPEQTYTSNLAGLNAQEAQLTQGIAQAQVQLSQLRLTRQQDIANDMQLTAAAVAQARQTLLAADALLERRDVTAPENGVVTNIQLYTPGSSIQPGQTIMELVPAGDRLIVEAHVAPIDIEQVIPGQRANVRLMSYRHRQLPVIPGRVITVSPDQQVDSLGAAPYYLVRLAMDTAQLAKYPRVVLTAGMPTESYIVGEPRTVASYVIAPIVDAMYRSLRD